MKKTKQNVNHIFALFVSLSDDDDEKKIRLFSEIEIAETKQNKPEFNETKA